MKNPMFLLLWLCSAVALVLAYFKILCTKQWFPAGLLLVIGVSVILISVWLLRSLNRLEIPIEAHQSAATMAFPGEPIKMQLSSSGFHSDLDKSDHPESEGDKLIRPRQCDFK